MSANRLVFEGLAELKVALRNLAPELAAEAGREAIAAANSANADIRRNYKAGMESLAQAVVVERDTPTRFGAGAKVITKHKLAWIFENGTQVRRYKGASRGVIQPPLHAFVPPVMRARRRFYERLKEIVRRQGLEVSGDG